MRVGDTDATADRYDRVQSPPLESIRNPESAPPRATVFDPRPARLDDAWIEVDASVLVSLRAMR